jgi:SpoVK/Ycf46/Vps4 family AAA+-type ATPase
LAPLPWLSFFTGQADAKRTVDSILPLRTFQDVVLPPATRRALGQALGQLTSHDLVFRQWGLGDRHPTGQGLTFNFAGPSGTGKTICAEALANAIGRRLLVVRYSEVESMWMGETPKNVAAVFRRAREEQAVLFFDEADAIASRRSTLRDPGATREANAVVNVLLQELDACNGVVIFATNMASNFDPAFERRIRTHVLFEMPGVDERDQIWRVQVHPTRTPLADDVDFRVLAERYPASGGSIRNAVFKAALAAAAEPGPDAEKQIAQRHLVAGIEDVLAAGRVMRQSLFDETAAEPLAPVPPASDIPADLLTRIEQSQAALLRQTFIAATAGGTALLLAVVALLVATLR